MDLSPIELLAASALVALGAFAQSLLGFGLGVVAAALLYLIDPRLVPGPLLFLALILSALNVWRNRAGLAVQELGSAIIGRIPGMLLALWVLELASSQTLSILLGGSVLVAVVLSRLHPRIEPTRPRLFWAGFASGFMGTSTSIGGPPMALLYQGAAGSRIRANLSGYFIVGSSMSLLGLIATGHYDWDQFLLSLALLPACLAGFWAAGFGLGWVDQGRMRPLLLIVCTISALAALVNGLQE